MLEILDPKKLDCYAYEQELLNDIRKYSLLPNSRIGWNYCMDYTWMAVQSESVLQPHMKVVDIGAGPGAIHGYLEAKHNVDIIGIDMKHWDEDYVEVVGDFTDQDVRNKYGFLPNSLDVIISASAFEHNDPTSHKRLFDTCMSCLKPGGKLITTFSTTFGNKTRVFRDQWNLCQHDIESMYGESFSSFDYWSVWWRWRQHREIPKAYKDRYGKWLVWHPSFLAVGAHITKV